uniref:F-box domain-containing protein n=1 Tax=Acrobeloides nanus TaxID=290746 RepID=A0A914BVV8_9BILA
MAGNEETSVHILQERLAILEEQNQIYLQTINTLSSELLTTRKRTVFSNPDVGMKLRKIEPTCSESPNHSAIFQESTSKLLPNKVELDAAHLPIEILVLLFKYLRRDDLDRCRRVCHQWNALIQEHSRNLPHRQIMLLKLIDKNHISLEAKTLVHKKKYSFSIEEYDRNNEFFSKLKKLLRNSMVKRLIICNLTFTDEFVRRLREAFFNQPAQINRIELLAVNLMRISPDVFHRLLGQVLKANQYFVDGVRGASEDHFSSALFDQKGVKEAEDFTVYDIRSVDNDEIALELGNDVNNEFFSKLKKLLRNSTVKRLIICNLTFTDEFVRRLREAFFNQPAQINRIELLAVNLMRISPDVFHRLLGQVLKANQYFVDGVRGASEDHFSSALFDQKGVKEAEDFTVYDIRSVDNDEIALELGNDVLLDLIFGSKEMPERNSLYLDSPEVTSSFLEECLKKFFNAENIDRMLNHVEFAHCREQNVATTREITLEYEHPIQIEWSTINQRTGRVLEARISRNGDGDNFCHLTLNLQPIN